MTERPQFVIGIDGGASTGIAEFDVQERKLTRLETMTFWGVFDFITGFYSASSTLIVIEWPSGNKPSFHEGQNTGTRDQIAQRVGRVKRETELLASGFERKGYVVKREVPIASKWNAKEFKTFTKWQGRTNSHERDAARLCFGVTQWPVEVRAKTA